MASSKAILLLTLAVLLPAISAQTSEAAVPPRCRAAVCCAMAEPTLRSCRTYSKRCAADRSVATALEPRSCASCPPGECRVGDKCMCTVEFIFSPKDKSSCLVSHGNRWDGSARVVGLADNTRRHCPGQKGERVIPAACRRSTCCEMTSDDLQRCNAHSDRCLGRFPTQVVNANYCIDCPVGECRLGRRCVCTMEFYRSSKIRSFCVDSHGKHWPSLPGSIDAFRKNCTKVEPPMKAVPA